MEVSAVFDYNALMEYNKQGHSVYYTRYHLVMSTKYRRKIFRSGIGEYLEQVVEGIGRRVSDLEIREINTDEDHVHILLSIPPKYSVSEIVNKLKANTGRVLRRKFTWLDKVYWDQDGIWSVGYFVSTVGINEETIRKYIEHQGREDSGEAKLLF
ncbi:IS200/IS605 family transposase [Sedimentisphaera salicampi]|uniref:Transposase n=1 Tax=Sedimentisphaera salicampi TaxID=1941349 RepID=A0A1W6LM14_9BACT|nr:IS200/IS605 family transposase [Sedimentisphaera salicampi]ARN56819.1 Transposase [Sedimentisphaera salicampi]